MRVRTICLCVSQDTFLDADHVRESFPGHRVEVVNNSGQPTPVRPFRVTFPDPPAAADDTATPRPGGKRKAADGAANGAADGAEQNGAKAAPEQPVVRVESYKPPDPGPYPQDEPPQNTVRFTPVQVEAIRAGAQPGLTMVVGPPGASDRCISPGFAAHVIPNAVIRCFCLCRRQASAQWARC